MSNVLPILCVPGLGCSARLYAEQIPQLWTVGPVTIARHDQHESMAEIARAILESAPERFALIGLSMGGHISFEILRQAPERITKLALLDTSSRPDTPERAVKRRALMDGTRTRSMSEISDELFPLYVHPMRHNDSQLRDICRLMAEETGAAGFIRQQTALMNRPDSRPTCRTIHCPTLVLAGDSDELTPPAIAAEIAGGIDGARLVIVPDCGHLSTLERPREVTEALIGLLRS